MPNCINWELLINGKTGNSRKGDKMGGGGPSHLGQKMAQNAPKWTKNGRFRQYFKFLSVLFDENVLKK